MYTREQKYAADVFTRVTEISRKPKSFQKQYGSMAHKLPVLIRSTGLVQSLAFVEARGKEPHRHLLTDLARTVGYQDGAELLEKSRTVLFADYLRLSQKAMAALLWYKRFAQSVLNVEVTDEDEVHSQEIEQEANNGGA